MNLKFYFYFSINKIRSIKKGKVKLECMLVYLISTRQIQNFT